MKLISMTDFVLEQDVLTEVDKNPIYHFCRCIEYANFLKQPLTLGMFVPCDEDGDILKEPKREDYKAFFPHTTDQQAEENYQKDLEQYQQAKDRVLFVIPNLETDIDKLKYLIGGNTVELLTSDGGVELTTTALKQIGLTK